jgi:hypothetical protein
MKKKCIGFKGDIMDRAITYRNKNLRVNLMSLKRRT